MTSKRLDPIWDFSRYGYDIQAQCSCGHVAVLPANKLVMLVHDLRSSARPDPEAASLHKVQEAWSLDLSVASGVIATSAR